MKKLLWCALAAIGLGLASCGNSNNLYPVSGTVTYKSRPAAGAAVFFHRQGGDPMNEHAVMGIVQEDGSFTLVCGSLGKGAPPGEYDVLIQWMRDFNPAKGLAHKGRDRFKGRYADPKHPRLHAVVNAGPNNLFSFDLADAEPVRKRGESP
jgi:hypothetical protein